MRKKSKSGVLFLMALIFCSYFLCTPVFSKGSSKNKGIIPAAPPVNVITSDVDVDYTGFGYLAFNVILPESITPEFTLGDEDATWEIGDNEFASKGLVYVHEGKLRQNYSLERAWIAGFVDGESKTDQFVRDGVSFSRKYDRTGGYIGSRNTLSKRLQKNAAFTLDYSFTSMWAFFQLSGQSRVASLTGTPSGTQYVSDFDGNTLGLMYRPVLTIQPVFSIGNALKFIPFAGASAFISVDYSSWELNEWEDVNYGKDCFDGCPDGGFFGNLIPFEAFYGFDVEILIAKTHSISLSTFFAAGLGTDTDSMSEIYIVYSKRFK